jgi:hypothetical protein
MASEPYWAEAPSRSTSMRSMAEAGIRSRSTGAPPRPTRARLLIRAVPWRRLPLTRNRAWSPFRPRMVMARTVHEVPPPLMPGRLNDGIRVLSTSFRPTLPVAVSCALEITSTGAGLSATVRRTPRTPVTITPSSATAPSTSAEPRRPRGRRRWASRRPWPGRRARRRSGSRRRPAGRSGTWFQAKVGPAPGSSKASVYPPRGAHGRRVVLLVSKVEAARRRPRGAPCGRQVERRSRYGMSSEPISTRSITRGKSP